MSSSDRWREGKSAANDNCDIVDERKKERKKHLIRLKLDEQRQQNIRL